MIYNNNVFLIKETQRMDQVTVLYLISAIKKGDRRLYCS